MQASALSGLDTACLAAESAHAPLQTVALLVLDASASLASDPADALIHAILGQVQTNPRLRATLVETPLGLVPPAWADRGAPDLEQHLTRLRIPAPGGPRELGRLVDDVLSRPLPRGCPLWEMQLVEGLSSGRIRPHRQAPLRTARRHDSMAPRPRARRRLG